MAKGKKGKRGDDSDDDFVDPIAVQSRRRRGETSEMMMASASAAAAAAAPAGDDDEPTSKKAVKKDKKKGKNAVEEPEEEEIVVSKKLSKADVKKQKAKDKGRGGDSSEDEPAAQEEPAGKKGGKAPAKGGKKDADEAPAPKKLSKAQLKKQAKKGGKKDSDDDDDGDAAMGVGGDDDDEDEDDEATVEVVAKKPLSKAQQKKAKKGGKRQDSDSDEDPIAKAMAAGGDDSDEEEDEPVAAVAKPLSKSQLKKQQQQAKAAVAAAAAAAASDDSDDEYAASLAVAPVAAPVSAPAPVDDEAEDMRASAKGRLSKAERTKQKKLVEATVEEVAAAAQAQADDEAAKAAAAVGAPTMASVFGFKKKKKGAAAPVAEDGAEEAAPEPPRAPTAFELAMAAAAAKKAEEKAEDDEDDDATGSFEEALERYTKKLAKAEKKGDEDKAAKYRAKLAKCKRALEKDSNVDAEAALAAAGGLMSADGAAWREDSVLKLAKTAAETLEIALADAVAANGGKPLSSKVKRKVEKDFAGRARDAAELAAKEAASVEGAQFACSQSAVNEDSPEWQNALDVKIESFSISAAGKTLFDNSPLSIVHGRRYGIVGPNGRGKTTLLKMIASGELKTPPRVGCLYVEQEVVADGTRAVDAVLRADTERASLLDEEAKLLKSLETGKSHVDGTKLNNEGLREVSERLSLVGEELKAIGAASAEAKARRILFGLGFSPEMQMRETKLFSGGWRMRISLARALFMEPVLLMLDEPTNHLDLNAVIWLDDYLQRYKHTLIVVSHDQDFLNSVCDEILHISEERTLDQYRGNYDTFKTLELQKRNAQMKAWEKQEKAIKVLKGKSNTKTKAEELVKKMQASKAGREPGARKKKDQAIALGTDSADVATLIEKPKEYLVEMSFPPVTKLSPPVLQVVDATFRYSPELPYIFNDMNFGVDQDSRICIVGNNGSGKTTLLQLMIGKLAPTEGEVKRNNRLRMGVYNQHFVERLPMDECPIDYLRRLFNDETYQSVRNMLGRYGLEGHAHSIAMRDLSGGQKARVVLVELSLYAPHMLLLDEPTNNLDIETIDALCTAIKEYDGGVICVTHDARLIEATNMRLWVVENRCVTEWGEPFSKYREHLLEKLEAAMASDDQRVTAAGLSVDMGGNRS